MDWLWRNVVENKQKAIVGFVLGFVGTYLAQYGFDIETLTVKELLDNLLYGLLTYIGVYAKANKK